MGRSLNACLEVGGQPAITSSVIRGRKSNRLQPGVTGVNVGAGGASAVVERTPFTLWSNALWNSVEPMTSHEVELDHGPTERQWTATVDEGHCVRRRLFSARTVHSSGDEAPDGFDAARSKRHWQPWQRRHLSDLSGEQRAPSCRIF